MEKVRHFCLICFKHSYVNICILTIAKFIVLKELFTFYSSKFVLRFSGLGNQLTLNSIALTHFKNNFVPKNIFLYLLIALL